MHGGHCYLLLNRILPPPAKDMINDIGEESDDNVVMWNPYVRSFPITKIGFQQLERKHPRRIITQQRYLEFSRKCVLSLFPDYEERVVADKNVA